MIINKHENDYLRLLPALTALNVPTTKSRVVMKMMLEVA